MALSSAARTLRALVSLCLFLPLLAFASGSAGTDARVIWLTLPGSVLKVVPVDGSVAAQLPALKQPGMLAVEGANDTLWVYGQKAIVAFDHLGNTLLSVNLPANFHGGTPAGMAVDNAAGNIWIAIQKDLYRLDMGGVLKADYPLSGNAVALSLDTDSSQVWIAESQGIEVFAASGARALKLAAAGAVAALAYDAGLDQMWVLSTGVVSRYSSSGQLSFSAPLGKDLAGFIAPDGQGGIWVAGTQDLAYVSAAGQSQFVIQPFAGQSGTSILGLVTDTVDHSAWVADGLHLRHYDTAGALLLEAALPAGSGNGNGLQQLGYYVDTVPPTVSITAPQDGLWTNHKQPVITLAYGDNTGVDPASIKLTANDQPLAATCQPAADGSGATCTPDSAMSDGGYGLIASVADYAGNVAMSAAVTFHVLTVPPTITVTSPAGPYTNQPNFFVTGSVDQPGTLTVNGAGVQLAADGSFTAPVTLSQGDNILSFVATDLAGNVTTVIKTVNLNTIPPIPVVNGDITVTGPTDGKVTVTGKAGAAAPGVSVTITDIKTGQSVTVTADASGAFTATLAANSDDNLLITETDRWGNVTADPTPIAVSNLPPDPASVAPALDPTTFTTFADQNSFLYTGANPIQSGVTPGAIDPTEVSVIRGKVTDGSGTVLPGVTISVFGHPELGHTLSRADGQFDLAVNGGGIVTLDYALKDYLPAQRKVQTQWNVYTSVDTDVALIKVDPVVSPVSFGSAAPQLVAGSVVTDARGTRQAAVYFPAGTTATMVMPDGSTQSLSGGSFRATEFTVGPMGSNTMPADVPTGSGYTYAVDLSFDEAQAAGAQTVTFNQPVPVYLDNFLNVPVGYAVPNYYLDRARGDWDTTDSGDVIKLLSLDPSGNAVIAVDPAGKAATAAELAQLGITTEELGQIAQRFKAGATFWRFGVNHFTVYDFNLGYQDPSVVANPQGAPKKPPCPDHNKGCDISAEYQTLGEDVPVTGTPFVLRYDSNRQPGYTPDNVIHLQVTGATIPANLDSVVIRIDMAGEEYTRQVKAYKPNQIEDFVWDSHDRYGRVMYGQTAAAIHVGYVFNPVHYFALPKISLAGFVTVTIGSADVATHPSWKGVFTTVGSAAVPPRGGASGIDGWSLSVHHALDPATRTVYLGDGSTRLGSNITTIVRQVTGNSCCAPLPQPVATTSVNSGRITVASNGDIYFTGRANGATGIFKIDHGTQLVSQISGAITGLGAIAVAQDGSLYYVAAGSTSELQQIFRLAQDGTKTLVAGLGQSTCPTGDNCNLGGPATQALLQRVPKLSIGSDGTLYFLDEASWDGSTFVAAVNPDGTWKRITNTYGNWLIALAAGPNGSVYFGGSWSYRIYQWKPDGSVTAIAGNGIQNTAGDGGPATSAALFFPAEIYAAPDGTIFINDYGRIRRVGNDGIITTVAGGGTNGSYPVPAIGARGLNTDGALAPDGTLKFANGAILSVEPAVPGAGPILGSSALMGYMVPSSDGRELYTFDQSGRHLQTLDTVTKAVIYSFGYDANGNFVSVTDANGRVTAIGRDASGNATSITSPDGQVTALTADGNGYLQSIADAAGDTYKMVTRPDGLLTSFIDPNGNPDTYSYDVLGQLYQNRNAVGGGLTLGRTETLPDYTVTTKSAGGLTQTYQTLNNSDGTQTLSVTEPDGTVNLSLMNRDGDSEVDTAADGTITTLQRGADPRFGADVKLPASVVIKMPSGLTRTVTLTRSAPLSNAADPFSFKALTDTMSVNGLNFVSSFAPATKTWTSTTPAGRRTVTVVDDLNRPVSIKFGNLDSLGYAYDSAGRIQTVTAGSGSLARTTQYSYYAAGPSRGRLQSVTDPLNRTIGYQYDTAGRVTVETLPDDRQVQFGYDANGNLTSLTPAGRPAHAFDYDGIGETQDYTPPAVAGVHDTATHYGYNLDRQLTQITRPDGQQIALGYDTGGRLATVTLPTGVYQYSYVPVKGQMQTITAPGGESLAYGWDGKLNTSVAWTGEVPGSLARTFDKNFRITALTVDGISVNYAYDNDGLLTTAGAETVKRDTTDGLITGTMLGSIVTADTYDGFGAPQMESVSASTTSLYNVTYTRDNIGRISGKTETINGVGHSYVYGYDTQGRLNSVTADGVQTSYDYDANGNRTTVNGAVVAAYDDQDRLQTYGSNHYSYTAGGETLSKTDANGQTRYTYDVLGNLLEVKLPGGTDVQYVVDGQNRRVGKKVDGTLVQGFLYQDQLSPVAELDGSGAVVQRYVYGTRANVPDYIIQGSSTYRVIVDQLGSPRLVVDAASGTVVEQIDYDAWGNVVNDTNPGFQPFGFGGGVFDRDTGLSHFGARDYDAVTGRWLRTDPIGFRGGSVNLYGYVLGDPVNLLDSAGMSAGDCGCKGDSGGYWNDVLQNFEDINDALPGVTVPSVPYVPGASLGAISAGATADAVNGITIVQWAMRGFGGSASGAATFTAAETGVIAAGTAALNFAFATAAYESGAFVGSLINSIPIGNCRTVRDAISGLF